MPVNNRWVIIVDDDEVRMLLKSALSCEAKVFEVTNGIEAIEFLNAIPTSDIVDLLILDLDMPRFNGFEFLSYAKEFKPKRKLPICIHSSRKLEGGLSWVRQSASYCLEKGMAFQDYKRELSSLVHSSY